VTLPRASATVPPLVLVALTSVMSSGFGVGIGIVGQQL